MRAVICPVCEREQPGGASCDVCGRALAGAPPVPAIAEPLADLEATALDGGGAPPVLEPVPGLEPTIRSAVGEVTTTELPDLERAGPGPRGPAPRPERAVATTCRYCRAPAVEGEAFCSQCGMRIVRHRRGG